MNIDSTKQPIRKETSIFSYWPIASIYISAYFFAYFTSHFFSGGMMMGYYMGYVLVLFGLIKLRDLKGFVKNFRKYDPLAGRSRIYARAYPFLELILGGFFIFGVYYILVSIITIVVYTATLYGALQSIMKKQELTCACVGTDFKLPLSHVSTAESLVMIGMCLYMIVSMF